MTRAVVALAHPWLVSLLAATALLGCAGGDKPAANTPAQAPAATAPAAYAPKPVRFENPGGMWMPHQMAEHAATLEKLGLRIDPKELQDPTSSTLQSVVSLGGCSASFVSAEGLVITNHHCATGALQFNATPSQNLLEDGFFAQQRSDEKSNGPTARVLVTEKVSDVTEQVRDLPKAIEGIKDPRARYEAAEARQKALVAACEQGRPGVRCSVSSFYEGAKFYLIEQLEIRDVRLVFAPPDGVGTFGGEIDNWRWPRQTGDFTIFRAYVGKDGKPADFSPDNVPYRPKSHLKIASEPLRETDLVMVAGYPGRTYSLKTHAEVEEAVGFSYPRRQKLCEDMLAALETATKDDKEAQIRANPFVRRYGNALTNTKGQLDGLVKDGLLGQKAAQEEKLRAFVDADPARKAKYAKVLEQIADLHAQAKRWREADAQLTTELLTPRLLGAAHLIVKMAEERPKADKERDPEVQERNWPKLQQSLASLDKQYSRVVDEALLAEALRRAGAQPEKERSAAVAITWQQAKVKGSPAEAAHALYEGTELDKTAQRASLFEKATLAQLRASKDPLIQWALRVRPLMKQIEARDEARTGAMLLLKDQYFEVLAAFVGKPIAPDANSTLRITYGTVRGYRPSAEASVFRPFTPLSSMLAKNTGKAPFAAPPAVVEAAKAQRFGGYVDAELGEVPVNFLADLHITGGNSGSATLNAKGELVGLVFDGNYEALASDWLFKPATTRSIHVDIRYVTWLLDAVYGARGLLEEMGVKPSFAAGKK